jgi:UTP-glucose-1-phosphate uridylyltransferase
MLLPVIMAGGTGSRLWPMSRELYPKQFLRLYGQNSMLQETISRLSGLDIHEPMVICNEEHRFLVAEQLRQLNKLSKNIILEPVGRNTAPAIALAALQATQNGDDPLMLVLAADHIINNQQVFHDAIRVAEQYAHADHLVTFGIVPNTPETGYGYIQRGDALGEGSIRLIRSPALSRSLTWSVRRPIWPPGNITGTAACLCSGRKSISPSWQNSARIFSKSARLRSMRPIAAATLSASRMRCSAPVPTNPLTMR